MSDVQRPRTHRGWWFAGAGVLALAAAVVSPLLVVLPLLGYALWVGRRRQRRGMLVALLVVLALGAADVVVNGYFLDRQDCGSRYDPDLGCTTVLPGWLVPFGLAMLAVAVALSLALVVSDLRRRHLA